MASRIFPFLSLPTEIRLQVYRIALPRSDCHREAKWEQADCPVEWHHGTCPGILFVNRQISQEATEVLYKENAFAIYVRHPRQPRLSMNESRPDPESFMLFSWARTTFSHPRNPRLPYSLVAKHQNLHNIRRLYVSLPIFDDLSGVDMYMKKSSYAAFHGINGWVRKCSKSGRQLDAQEKERMSYVQQSKAPLDELGQLLQILPHIDELVIGFQPVKREIDFAEYLLDALLAVRHVGSVRCFYIAESQPLSPAQFLVRLPVPDLRIPDVVERSKPPIVERCTRLLEGVASINAKKVSNLATSGDGLTDMDRMHQLLQAVRAKQQSNPSAIPTWLSPMME
ncbi:hypothetical protein MMC21_001938 [Puttea exsequens]|nr:hypothetical protein [Puttea exsequens]